MSNWPLLQFGSQISRVSTSQLSCLGAVVAFFSVGFAIDYIVGRHGMGPYWNAFYAMLGAYAGLCARDWWLQTLRRLRPLSDDHRGCRRLAGDGRDGERGRQTLNPALLLEPALSVRDAPAGARRDRGRRVAPRDIFCNCALHKSFGAAKATPAGRA